MLACAGLEACSALSPGVPAAARDRTLASASPTFAPPPVHVPAQATPGQEDESSPLAQASSDDPFFLPFFATKARERGYELPLPLGIGASFMFIDRPTEVSTVRAGVNNEGLRELDFLSFDARASVRTAITRLDAWVLPMLNAYLIGGYIWNTSEVNTLVNLPGAPDTPITSEGDLEGPVYGAGLTAVGGYQQFFASLDFNITRSELGNLSEFIAKITTLRVGWNGEVNQAKVRAYTGAAYWDTKRTIEGEIPGTGGAIQSIQFAVDQEPVDPVTMVVGTSIAVSDSLWFMLEYQGWGDTQVGLGGVTFRF